MIVYFGQNFTAAKTGTAVREVICEKCGCDYRYRLFRRGAGSGTSPYSMDNKGAQRRAENMAAKKLQKLLLYAVDPVPCPECGWIQADMVDEYQSRHHGWLYGLAITFAILFGVAIFLWSVIATKGYDRAMKSDDVMVLIVMGVLLAMGVGLPILTRKLLIRRLNPNRNFPQRPDPIPGAPKAFRPGEEGVLDALPADAPAGQLSYQHMPPEIEPGGWVTVQLALWPVPATCCSCLGQTQQVRMYTATATNSMKLPVRLCDQCRKFYRTKSLVWMLIGFIICGAGAFFWVASSGRKDDEVVAWLVGGFAGLLGVGIAAALAHSFARPVGFSRFNGPLNTVRVRFKNSDYTPVFMNEPPPASPTVRSPVDPADVPNYPLMS